MPKRQSGNKKSKQSNFAKLSIFQPNKYKFKKNCPLSVKGAPKIDYKNIKLLRKYVSENGLTIKSYDSYADHYSSTLSLWRNEFNKKWDLIKNQGFDSTFKRMWEFYLSYCEAGFKSKNIDLIQFSLQNK